MAENPRTDSFRTELLSPEGVAAGTDGMVAKVPSWRLNMDKFRLPATTSKRSHHGIVYYWKSWKRQRKVAKYYEKQESLVKGFNEVDSYNELGVVPGTLTEDEKKQEEKNERWAIYTSNVANMVIFVAKVYASVESRSLAVIASTLDSLLDLLSGFILWFTAYAMRKPNQYRYPIGKNRMQPVGIVVFASVMATLGIQILLESARELISKAQPDRDPDKVKWMVGIMASVTVVKFCLTIYCRRFTNEIIRAYAQDHFFDVITNSIGLATALLAIKFYWWLDPLGAILRLQLFCGGGHSVAWRNVSQSST